MLRFLSMAVVLLTVSPVGLSQGRGDPAPGPVSMPPEQQKTQAGDVHEYWTPERMQNAQPRPLPGAVVSEEQLSRPAQEADIPAGSPILVPGWSPGSGEPPPLQGDGELLNMDLETQDILLQTYGAAPTNPKDGPYGPFQRWTMQGRYDTWPRSIHGKLFFSIGSSNYVCSASVIGSNVIATAGHCISTGDGAWATNFRFCPGYSQSGPMSGTGCWGVRGGATSEAYFLSADVDYDFACLVTNPTGDQFNGPIGARTGWAGTAYNFSSSQPVVQFGYPQGAPFDGKTIQQVASTEWYEVDMGSGGQKSKYIGSDLTGGSSGGGWFLSWRHPSTEYPDTDNSIVTDPAGARNGPYINGVNSHRRCRAGCSSPPTATVGVFWEEMGSPQFLNSPSDTQDASDIFKLCFDEQ
ncbi:trypsin-like serine peptidase [Thiocapsa roseopersicina]|uniref:Trypsin n=1 Tax=Thiocapsa roseopersicina TaxID=1058 RepID=A0A1H2V2Q6_THIRO|nr:trypsin-like serine protease [Thiocapsa roseopersicina]SDW62608.1 Trypsin [Thiocapsa roseopersicina]